MERLWDPQGKWTNGQLRQYEHWALEVSYCQHTLGSFIIFARRPVKSFSELESLEATEYIRVVSEIETALKLNPTFNPSRINYLQLGNGTPHLHLHAVPRYNSSRYFDEREWIDTASARGIPPWTQQISSDELVGKIRQEILSTLR